MRCSNRWASPVLPPGLHAAPDVVREVDRDDRDPRKGRQDDPEAVGKAVEGQRDVKRVVLDGILREPLSYVAVQRKPSFLLALLSLPPPRAGPDVSGQETPPAGPKFRFEPS